MIPKRRYIPLGLMLLAGAVTCIITFSEDYDLLTRLVLLFCVMLVFFLLGVVVESFLNSFEKEIKEKEEEERRLREEQEKKEREEQEAKEKAAQEEAK